MIKVRRIGKLLWQLLNVSQVVKGRLNKASEDEMKEDDEEN